MRIILIIFIASVLTASCDRDRENGNTVIVKILWSQEDGSHNNYRIPSLIVTRNGTLLAFAEGREGGDAGDIDMLLKRSGDNGNTWGEQLVVWDDSGNSCGNPCPVMDRHTGRIFLFMTWNLGSDVEAAIIRKESQDTRVPYMCYSDDEGLTWSEPRSMLESCKKDGWGWYATGPGVGIQLTSERYDGRLIIPCNHSYDDPANRNRDGFGYGSHVLISDDGGASWRFSESIVPEMNESQVVELTDGTLMLNMRSYMGKGCRAIARSHDGGETWTQVRNEPQLVESVCQGSIIRFGHHRNNNMYLFSNPSVPVGRSHMTIHTSFDDCTTWSNSRLVYRGPSGYSCLAALSDGNIGLFFEAGVKSPYEKMIFVSISPGALFMPHPLIDSLSACETGEITAYSL
jgi:sialidase-1